MEYGIDLVAYQVKLSCDKLGYHALFFATSLFGSFISPKVNALVGQASTQAGCLPAARLVSRQKLHLSADFFLWMDKTNTIRTNRDTVLTTYA